MLDRAGLSNREIAESLEVAPETVSRWRSGQQEMRGRDLRAVIVLLATRGIVITEEWVQSGQMPAAQPAAPTEAELEAFRKLTPGQKLARVMNAANSSPRGAQLEPKDVAAPDPRKKAAAEDPKGKGKRAG